MKGYIEYGELAASEKMSGLITVEQCGRASFVDKENPDPIDISMAQEGFSKAKAAIAESSYDIVVLDELCVALDFNLIELNDVTGILEKYPEDKELIVTGRYCPQEIMQYADLVTEMREVKHYYSKGIEARQGFEF